MSDRDESDAGLNCAHHQAAEGTGLKKWNICSLGELASIERGKFSARPRNDPRFFGGSYPFIQTGDVSNSNGVVTSFSQTLNEKGLRVSRLFPAHTLFFTIAANIGDVAIAPFATACPDSLVAISPNRQTDQRWLFYSLELRKKVFEGLATQNAQLNINLEKLRPYQLPVPPLTEQRAIAAALSDLDALIGALDRLIAKKRDLKQAAMQQLLTGQTRLPGFSGKWKTKTIEEVALVDPEQLGGGTRGDYEFKYISLEDVDVGKLCGHSLQVFSSAPSRARRKLCNGDVLISTVRPNLMSHLLFEETGCDWICSTGFSVVRCLANVAHPSFVFAHLFESKIPRQIDMLLTGSNYPAINSRDVRRLELDFPSYEEQAAIAAVATNMGAEIFALERRRDKTRLLKQGMMQELLTGRIRLV